MYILGLFYYKSSESKYADDSFDLKYLKGNEDDFIKLYNLHEVLYGGEIDYERETNIDEVKKWLEDGIISLAYPSKDSKRFNDIVLSATSPLLRIKVYYWQSGYD